MSKQSVGKYVKRTRSVASKRKSNGCGKKLRRRKRP